MRSVGRLYSSAERKEILTEEIEMHSKEDIKKHFQRGAVVDAVYLYEIMLYYPRIDCSVEEIVEAENAIKVMFVKFGEKCLDEQFLLKNLQIEYPNLCIDNAKIVTVEKFYKSTLRRGRMGTVDVGSRMFNLTLEKHNNII